MRNLIYFVQEALHGLRSHALGSFAAIGTIAACLLLTGCFGLLAVNLQLNVEQMMGDREFLVYLEDDLSQEDYDAVGEALTAMEDVEEATFISNEQALENQLSSSSILSDYFQNVDYNLLQNRYRVVVTDADALASCVEAAEGLDGVEHVYASYSLAQQITTLRNQCLTGAGVMVVLLVVLSVFIISNVVRLAVVARSEEIAIMRIVGATNGFIRAPFLVEGLLIGLIGGLCAALLTGGLYGLVERSLTSVGSNSVFSFYTIQDIWPVVLLATCVAGLLTGLFGTILPMQRVLKTA
ncbi:MAG: permease-like cell division protein FtsX [Clostridiales bacterium]|nr:permease-like cell division protein FtsX [Clostridiales bacterium]